jgi:hypothetical protein
MVRLSPPATAVPSRLGPLTIVPSPPIGAFAGCRAFEKKPAHKAGCKTLRHSGRTSQPADSIPIAELRHLLGANMAADVRRRLTECGQLGRRNPRYFCANGVLTGAETPAYISLTRGRCCRWRHWSLPSVLSIADCEKNSLPANLISARPLGESLVARRWGFLRRVL